MTFEEAARAALRIEAAIDSSLCTFSEPKRTKKPSLTEFGSVVYRNNRAEKRLIDEKYAIVP